MPQSRHINSKPSKIQLRLQFNALDCYQPVAPLSVSCCHKMAEKEETVQQETFLFSFLANVPQTL